MGVAFPFEFVDLGTPLTFKIEANPNFPTETDPVCIVDNLGTPAAPTFIRTGPPVDTPDPWELTFRWATVGGPAVGDWKLDAFLQAVGPYPNLIVPGFPKIIPGINPEKYDVVTPIAPNAIPNPAPPLTTAVRLYRLYASLQWRVAGAGAPVVKVAGRAKGPLIELYHPKV